MCLHAQKNYLLVTTGRVLGWTFATLCGGTVLVSISLSDLCSGIQLGKSLADFWSAIGLGILAGQLMGDNIMMYMGHPRYACASCSSSRSFPADPRRHR